MPALLTINVFLKRNAACSEITPRKTSGKLCFRASRTMAYVSDVLEDPIFYGTPGGVIFRLRRQQWWVAATGAWRFPHAFHTAGVVVGLAGGVISIFEKLLRHMAE